MPELTPKQAKVLNFYLKNDPFILLLEGAVRAGKTVLNNRLFLRLIKQKQNQRKIFMITGNTISSIRRNVLSDFEEFLGIEIKLSEDNSFKLFGNTIACFGGYDKSSQGVVKGFTSHGWLGNEMTEQHPDMIKQAFARNSADGARIFWDTNPASEEHSIYQDYILKSGERMRSGRIRIASFHFELWDNTFLSPDYIDGLCGSIPKNSVWYQRNILGKWVIAEGLIYEGWEKISQMPSANSFNQLIAGVDFGRGKSPYVMLIIGLNYNQPEQPYILTEVYQNGGLNRTFINSCELVFNDLGIAKSDVHIYADSADRDKIEEFRLQGFRISPARKEIIEGVEYCQTKHFKVWEGCTNTRREIANYQWDRDRNGKEREHPIKYDDHCMDALRYALYTGRNNRGVKTEPKGKIRVTPPEWLSYKIAK